MKKILLVVSLLSIFLMAAVPAFVIARTTFVNKTGYDLQVQVEEKGNPLNVWYFTIPKGTRSDPEEKIMDFPSTNDDHLWYITAWAVGTDKVADTKYKAGFPCFGDADRVLYDDASATRVFYLKGVKNKVLFLESSCEKPSVKWFTLNPERYYYPKGDNSWVY